MKNNDNLTTITNESKSYMMAQRLTGEGDFCGLKAAIDKNHGMIKGAEYFSEFGSGLGKQSPMAKAVNRAVTIMNFRQGMTNIGNRMIGRKPEVNANTASVKMKQLQQTADMCSRVSSFFGPKQSMPDMEGILDFTVPQKASTAALNRK